MANQDPRGCGLLALVALVAVVAFLGGRASVSWPGEAPAGVAVEVAPAIIATAPAPTPFPTARAIFVPRATPPPAATSESVPNRRRNRVARTRVPTEADLPPAATDGGGAVAPAQTACDPSYPTVCIPPPPPDVDCSITTERNFPVEPPDPHGLDSDDNGIGCEPIRSVPGQPADRSG